MVFVETAPEVGHEITVKGLALAFRKDGKLLVRGAIDVEGNTLGGKGIVDALRDLQQEQWFDLNGRKVNGPQGKGVYIVNGRKVIIK